MRKLGADERALWARVVASVTPIEGARSAPAKPAPRPVVVPPAPARTPPRPAAPSANTLDGGWDRRLSRGSVEPDLAVDLHGHSLEGAWRLLDTHLDRAIARGARILLLITGKPPGADRPGRGRIRAAVHDWLAASRHAGHIAAVRNAHPRHGGAGALYIVLKRKRPEN